MLTGATTKDGLCKEKSFITIIVLVVHICLMFLVFFPLAGPGAAVFVCANHVVVRRSFIQRIKEPGKTDICLEGFIASPEEEKKVLSL